MKFYYTLFFALFLSLQLSAQTITSTVIKKPSELRCNEVPAKLNNIVFGAIPPNSQNKPVVVYIHGWFDNGFAWFMAKNKWYENSYNAGYRTAFFFQSVSGAFEDNGKVIAEMIRETCRHYNTDRVIAVCHSKGGYDIDYALYNENVWDTVQGVITLSTPYWGAPMSDMIAVPFFRTILELIPIVGPIFQGKGSYQMQTAYMAGVVRPMMDNHPNNRPEKFHCFAAWGYEHPTVFPNAIPDDILKVVFPNYNPLCFDIPGFGTLAGNLMTGFMGLTGLLTNISAIQPIYENPQKNHQLNDGLAPYYSAIRPGSVVISQPPPSQQSYLNHIDVLLSSNMWNIVQPEIEYFKDHPVFRRGNVKDIQPVNLETPPAVSDIQFIQNKSIEINTETINKLYLIGEYKNEKINVYDEYHQLVKIIELNFKTQAMYDIFHEVDLSALSANKKYTLQSTTELTGLLRDGNAASIQLNTNSDKTYLTEEPLNIELTIQNWTDNLSATTVKGYLNRNIDENGEVIYDKLIPITFEYDEVKQAFVCSSKPELPNGVYNVCVFADGKQLKRFVTTSILLQQKRKQLSDNKNFMTVFPNPSNDIFTIQFDTKENVKYNIDVFDIVGKKVIEKNINNVSGTQQLQISTKSINLANGAYLISLSENGERKCSKTIVIN
jgi:hypothetical protein